MTKKGNLFFLIKSLSKSEKRYFKLFCVHQKVGNNYLRLFEAYDQQAAFDEEKIRRRFEGETFLRQLHVTKNYLSGLILKSLRNYYGKLSRNAEVKDMLRNIEILFIKELYNQCHNEIGRAERLARNYELYPALLEALGWKRRLMLARNGFDRSRLQTLATEEKEVIRKLQRQNEYWRLTAQVFDYTADTDGTFLQDPALLSHDAEAGLRAQILYHHIHYTYHTINGRAESGNRHLVNLVAFLEKYPHRIKDDPAPYVTALNNQIGSLIFQKKYEEVPPLLKKVKAVPKKYKLRSENLFTIRLHLRTFNVELELYRDTRQWESGATLIGEVQDYLQKHRKAVAQSYRLLFWYQFAYIYFMRKENANALKWVNEITNTNFGEEREDLQSYARLLNLMIHLEMGNTIVLKYAVDSCRRFMKKKKEIAPFEQVLLRFFSRISNAPKREYRELFQYLKADLFDTNPPLVTDNILDYLDFRSWIVGKIG